MVRGDEVQDEIAVFVGKVPDAFVVLDVQERAEFVPVAVEQAIVDRTFGLCVHAVRRRVERALPSLSALAFVVKASRECQKLLAPLIQAKSLRQGASAVFGPTLMFIQKLRIGRRAVLLGCGIVAPFVHDEPARRLAILRDFRREAKALTPVSVSLRRRRGLNAPHSEANGTLAEPRLAVVGGPGHAGCLVVQEPVVQSRKPRVEDQRGAREQLIELRPAFLVVGRFDRPESQRFPQATVGVENERHDVLSRRERPAARPRVPLRLRLLLAEALRAGGDPLNDPERLGLEDLARVRRCGLEERLDLLLARPRADRAHGEMRPPDDRRLWRVIFNPASQPGLDRWPPGVLLQRGHGPGFNEWTRQCGSERLARGGVVESLL